jgi:hypothetical protein
MRLKKRIVLFVVAALMVYVSISCLISEASWATKEKTTDSLRELVGLPSLSVGNLNPAVRNPGLEILCTGLYDVPGGYCNYFTIGVSFISFTTDWNITVSDGNEEALHKSP